MAPSPLSAFGLDPLVPTFSLVPVFHRPPRHLPLSALSPQKRVSLRAGPAASSSCC